MGLTANVIVEVRKIPSADFGYCEDEGCLGRTGSRRFDELVDGEWIF